MNAGGTLAGSGTVGSTEITGGTLAPGSAGGSVFGPLTVAGSLSFTAASTYLVQVSPAISATTIVAAAANLGGAQVSAAFLPGSYVARQYTILTATGELGNTTFNPTVLSNNANLSGTLSYDPTNAYLNIRLNFVTPTGPLSHQPAECRQRADELLHHHRRHPGRVRLAQCPGPHHCLRRTWHRHHPVRDQGRRLLPQPAARSHHRRPRRRLCSGRQHDRICRRGRRGTGLCQKTAGDAERARRLRDGDKGAGSALGAACKPLERLGRRLWRLRQDRRQRRRRIEQRHRARLGRRRRRRLQGHAKHPARLCARRRRHQLLAGERHSAADRPTCSRPVSSAGTILDRPISPARSITAGTTSPPTAR